MPVTVTPEIEELSSPRSPGQLLREELKKRRWTARILAVVSGYDPAIISRVMTGRRPLDARFALMLEAVLGVPARTWMQLDGAYQLALARLKRSEPCR